MKKIFLIIFTIILTLGLFYGNLSIVCAQDSSSEEFTLEEITVTAQKRRRKSSENSDYNGDNIRL